MPAPTIDDIFGDSSTQDDASLSIVKLDFVPESLTPQAINTAESLLVAIILKAAKSLTEATRLTDLVNRKVSISYSGQDLIDQGGGNVFLRDTYQVSLYRATSVQAIDPDNY